MCSLCGVLGGRGHWTESAANPDAFPERATGVPRRAERQARARLCQPILRHHGLTLAEWGGQAYILKSATGRTELVDNLSELWAAAERLTGRPCDPLDEDLLASLARTADR